VATTCVFCEITRRDREASVVYEEDFVLAFLDLHPITRGHTLIVPKRHAADLTEADEAYDASMFRAARLISQAVRKPPFRAPGTNLWLADGSEFQDVYHVHLHVIPRKPDDGFVNRFFDAKARLSPSRVEL